MPALWLERVDGCRCHLMESMGHKTGGGSLCGNFNGVCVVCHCSDCMGLNPQVPNLPQEVTEKTRRRDGLLLSLHSITNGLIM